MPSFWAGKESQTGFTILDSILNQIMGFPCLRWGVTSLLLSGPMINEATGFKCSATVSSLFEIYTVPLRLQHEDRLESQTTSSVLINTINASVR
jgi:hypothetical protein